MSYIRGLAYAIGICVTLNLHAGLLAPGALAQGLDAAQISKFQSKLESAKRTQADLNQNVTCLAQRDKQLVSQRAAQETLLGPLRARQPQLEAESRSRQLAYDGYLLTFQKEQYEIFRRRNQRERLGVVLGSLTAEAERIAAENVNQAHSKLQQSRLELNATSVSIAAGAAEIARIEHEIGRLKAALSDLRAEISAPPARDRRVRERD